MDLIYYCTNKVSPSNKGKVGRRETIERYEWDRGREGNQREGGDQRQFNREKGKRFRMLEKQPRGQEKFIEGAKNPQDKPMADSRNPGLSPLSPPWARACREKLGKQNSGKFLTFPASLFPV